jgi:hypothetical protein
MTLKQIAGWTLIACFMAGCNLQSPDATATPPNPTPAPVIPGLPITDGSVDPALCYFMPYGIGAPFEVYDQPETAQVQPVSIAQIEPNIYYPVVAQIDIWIQVVAAQDVLGWVRSGIGALSGQCDAIPRATNRPVPPPNVCSIYFDKVMDTDAVYTDQTGTTPLVPLIAGHYYPAVARGQPTGYKVTLPDGQTGWITTPQQLLSMDGALNGPCEALPVEVSTTPGS